jgi:hypothetical protein
VLLAEDGDSVYCTVFFGGLRAPALFKYSIGAVLGQNIAQSSGRFDANMSVAHSGHPGKAQQGMATWWQAAQQLLSDT